MTMTANQAYIFAYAICTKGHEPQRAQYGFVIQAFDLLADSSDAESQCLATRLYEKTQIILQNYDAAGNYVGTVANENGWTA